MNIQEYLNQVANLVENDHPWNEDGSKKYISKFDGSYITLEGMEDDVKFLADLEITEELTHGVGFSPLHNKWFGWSHRAIGGFTIGSKCEKGDCHYMPANIQEALDKETSFWDDEYNAETTAKIIDANTIEVSWKYSDEVPNESLRGKINSITRRYDSFGRGEWVAKTMEDAKQMAIDFNEGVS
tara:strand:+ start:99 stop:650 length:552 start_codon:yes stop_codon:yes gene_type:complete